MRVLVCGGRDYKDKMYLWNVLDGLGPPEVSVIISGMAKGADKFAAEWAKRFNFPLEEYPADWDDMSEPCFPKVRGTKVYNALAGSKRNQQMLDEGKPDLVVAFPGGTGTADMVRRARKAGVEVREVK